MAIQNYRPAVCVNNIGFMIILKSVTDFDGHQAHLVDPLTGF